MKLVKALIALYILASFITRPILPEGSFLGRFVLADFFGLAATVLFFLNNRSLLKNKAYTAFLFFLIALFIGTTASDFLGTSIGEVIILLFLLVVSQVIYSTYAKPHDAIQLFILLSWVNLIASSIGIYDSYFTSIGFPRIFPARADGEALSGFRNAGQAGAYIEITLFTCYAFFKTKLFHSLSKFERNQFRVSLVITFLFFVLTGKVAAYIGGAIGVLLYLVMKRRLSSFITVAVLFVALVYVFNELPSIAPQINKRIFSKVRTRILEPMDMTETKGSVNGTGFINKNFESALNSFYDNPIAGSGIGGFLGRYERHEVHSSYLKIIGETGLLGIITYSVFMFFFLKMLFDFKKHLPDTDPNHAWFAFLMEIRPFVIGWLISWAYTYHLRKREFWLAFAILSIAHWIVADAMKQTKLKSENE